MNTDNQKQLCADCKHFQDPLFGYPMCIKLKVDTTKYSHPKDKRCFERK